MEEREAVGSDGLVGIHDHDGVEEVVYLWPQCGDGFQGSDVLPGGAEAGDSLGELGGGVVEMLLGGIGQEGFIDRRGSGNSLLRGLGEDVLHALEGCGDSSEVRGVSNGGDGVGTGGGIADVFTSSGENGFDDVVGLLADLAEIELGALGEEGVHLNGDLGCGAGGFDDLAKDERQVGFGEDFDDTVGGAAESEGVFASSGFEAEREHTGD